MSLGIAFKGPEGIVLAADSRVTLMAQAQAATAPGQPAVPMLLPTNFDNATKLLKVAGQDFVGAVTYGIGALIGPSGARTVHSLMPEFEEELYREKVARLGVEDFARRLGDFCMRQWQAFGLPRIQGQDIFLLVGGYDELAAYGRVFLLSVPSDPVPKEQQAGQGQFGITFGGQAEWVFRLLNGCDPNLLATIRSTLGLSQQQVRTLEAAMPQFAAPIPWQFLPLQDCVDLSTFLISATMSLQKWVGGIHGVGGAIDVAIITRGKKFEYIQQKAISVR
jgi:hypothetical protein